MAKQETLANAMWLRILYNDIEGVKKLLKKGANVNGCKNVGMGDGEYMDYRPLHHAAGDGKLEIVALLVENNADLDLLGHYPDWSECSKKPTTAREIAVRNGMCDVVSFLDAERANRHINQAKKCASQQLPQTPNNNRGRDYTQQ